MILTFRMLVYRSQRNNDSRAGKNIVGVSAELLTEVNILAQRVDSKLQLSFSKIIYMY
jgi:hypothetical protein